MPAHIVRAYVAFNLIEGFLWIAIAGYLKRRDRDAPEACLRVLLPTLYIAFALTDFCEVAMQGPLPGWLWWTKLILGTILFGLTNYREHRLVGPLTAKRLGLRSLVFGALLGYYLSLV